MKRTADDNALKEEQQPPKKRARQSLPDEYNVWDYIAMKATMERICVQPSRIMAKWHDPYRTLLEQLNDGINASPIVIGRESRFLLLNLLEGLLYVAQSRGVYLPSHAIAVHNAGSLYLDFRGIVQEDLGAVEETYHTLCCSFDTFLLTLYVEDMDIRFRLWQSPPHLRWLLMCHYIPHGICLPETLFNFLILPLYHGVNVEEKGIHSALVPSTECTCQYRPTLPGDEA